MAADDRDNDRTRSFTVLAAGTTVANYKIISQLGAGGMGEIYLAEDVRLNRQVALKFIPQFMASDTVARARFTREARAAAALKHPNIVTIYEVSEYLGQPFIAMEYCEGKPLEDAFQDYHLTFDEM
jgi:serine/threonine protein kinase